METSFYHSRSTPAVSEFSQMLQCPLTAFLDIRTDLTQYIHSNGWRIASWTVALAEKYICYDAESGAIDREQMRLVFR